MAQHLISHSVSVTMVMAWCHCLRSAAFIACRATGTSSPEIVVRELIVNFVGGLLCVGYQRSFSCSEVLFCQHHRSLCRFVRINFLECFPPREFFHGKVIYLNCILSRYNVVVGIVRQGQLICWNFILSVYFSLADSKIKFYDVFVMFFSKDMSHIYACLALWDINQK